MTRTIRFSLKANKNTQKNVKKLIDFCDKYGGNIHTHEYLQFTTVEITVDNNEIGAIVQNADNQNSFQIFVYENIPSARTIKMSDIRTINAL